LKLIVESSTSLEFLEEDDALVLHRAA
jgi:hypothetical protein